MTTSPLGPEGGTPESGEALPSLGSNGTLLAALFDAIHHAVVLAQPDGTLLRANTLALDLFGSTLEKQGQPVWKVLADTLGSEKSRRLRRAMSAAAKGEVVRCKETITVPSGETVHLDVRVRPLYEQDAVAALVFESQDVTEWTQAEQHIRLLYNVISETMPQDEAQIQKALSLTTDLLGMDVGILSRVEGETYTIRACYPPGGALQAGQTFALGATYCSLTLEAEGAVAISHAERSPHRRHPCYQALGLEAYLGVPVYVAGAVYGTLNFSSAQPKRPPFSAADTDLAKMLSRWVGTSLERQAAERALRTSEDLLSGVLTSSLDGIFAFEAIRDEAGAIIDFRFLHVNPRAEEIVGRTSRELLGGRFLEEIPGVRDEGLFDTYVRVVETGESFENTFFYGHDNILGWFQIVAVKLGDGFTVTFRDITASKEAEEAVRESEERFRLLAENTTDLICLHELDSPFLYASPSAKHMLGFEPDELIGASPYDLIHPEDAARVRREMHEPALNGEHHTAVTYRIRRKSGRYIWLETSGEPLFDEQGEVVNILTSSRDVSERVRSEQALARTNSALKQRNRELQDFAYVASHDLQEPLRKIRAFAGLMEEDYGASVDETGQYYLDRMKDAAARMSTLISDLLAFSRVTTNPRPFETVDLNKVLADVLSDLEILIGEVGGRVEAGPLPTVEADPTQMRQLLQNLIGNALKFRRPEVPPVVHVQATTEQEDDGENASPLCRLTVADNAIGFDEKYLDRIFSPFQRLHHRNTYKGTGIGLAICRRIVERHSGSITATSTAGEGSTFTVVLPVKQESEAAGTTSA